MADEDDGGGGTPSGGVACSACGHLHADWVPKDRLSKATGKRREAEDRAKTLEAELAAATAATGRVTELETQLAELTTARDRLDLRSQAMRAGLLDDEGLDLALTLWDRVPADARPPEGIGGWLTSSAPRGVLVYMQPPTPAGQQTQQAAAQVPPKATKVPGQPPTRPAPTAEEILRMSPQQYKEAIKAGII